MFSRTTSRFLPQRIRTVGIVGLALSLCVMVAIPSWGLTLPETFTKLADSPTLKSPGIMLIEPKSDTTIYAKDVDVARAPASVLKLLSMTTVLNVMSPDLVFKTAISETSSPNTYYLQGSNDPWLTESPFEAGKYDRAFLPTLINKVLTAHPNMHEITLQYKDVYLADIASLSRYFSGRLVIHAVKAAAGNQPTTEVASIESPKLAKIIEFTLLYSDNVLADRLAHDAAHELGFPNNRNGIQLAFEKTLADLGIPSTGLKVFDGNGLSHETRITVRQIAELLVAIRSHPKYQVIRDGLPVAGETGTLKTRFVNDAPNAVGLVRAKTGWINNTVSLAGYVNVDGEEYVFVTVANHIPNAESARAAARVVIDQMLGTIAKP